MKTEGNPSMFLNSPLCPGSHMYLDSPLYTETLSDKEINLNENIYPNETYEFDNLNIDINNPNLVKELSIPTTHHDSSLDISSTKTFSQKMSTVCNTLSQVTSTKDYCKIAIATKQLINYKKRGRKKKQQKELEQSFPFKIEHHDNMAEDNMIKKIKPFYHNFLIKFINQCLQQLQIKAVLKKLDGKINSDTSIRSNQKMFQLPLCQVLSQAISSKCQKFDKNHNEKILSKIKGINPHLDGLLNLSYSYVYKELFINKNFSNKKFEHFVNCIPKQNFLENLLEKQSKELSPKLLDFAKNHFVQKIENGIPRKFKQIYK